MNNSSNQLIGHNVIQAILDSPVVKDKGVVAMPKDGVMGLIEPERVDPFFILDIAMVTSLMERWVRAMPGIPPYYAVKCNPDPSLVSIMATLGANFDCASKAEIELVLSLGVSPNRIIFANPCKPESHIQYAKSVGVNLVTYDSIFEIEKMKRLYPECGLVLRLKVPDEGAKAPLGSKYGALPSEIEPLLQAAKLAQLPVVGISFHVGSGSDNPETYKAGIAAAKAAFEATVQLGLPKLHLLDIGGGFTSGPHFETAAEAVKSALKLHFPNEPGLTVIAEPGRYFAESVMTLAANIIGKRVRGELKEYWIADGLYGSMNCIMYDNAKLSPLPLAATSDPWNPTCQGKERYFSTVFGPTCDALDTLVTDYPLPELEIGDWLVFEKMGAYTSAASSSFNGFLSSDIRIRLVCSGLGGTTSFEGEGADFEAVGMKEKVNGIFEVQPHKKFIDVA